MKIVKEIVPYVVIILVVILIRSFIITPVSVDGKSMLPNLTSGQILLLKKFDRSFDRFDVVVIEYNNTRLIKRIIGLPGEYVEYKNNKLYINGEYVEEKMISVSSRDFKLEELGVDKIPDDYYFVVGDNRPVSHDSRSIGLISKKDILGTTDFSIFPFSRFGFIK